VPGAAPRSAARDTSEFLASAFSVGGVGQEVRSQAQAQAERARHDPQSVDLANELFGDLSDAASNASARERADDSALAELPGAHVEPKPLSAEERLLAEKIPSIEDLVNETGQTGSHPPVSMGPRAPRASRAPSALAAPAAAGAIKVGAKPSLQPGAASVRPRVSLAPNEPRLSLELGPGSLNIASEAPRSVGRKRRGIVPILLGTLVVAGAAAGAYVFLGPGLGRVPSASAVPPEAHAAAAAEPAAVNPSANQAAPAANAAPVAADPQAQAIEVPLPVSTTPPGAEVVVDGQVAGTTPTTVKLHGGATVELSVRLHGYVSKTERITVAAGLAPRDISLQPMPYVLAVTTEPAGATVTVGSQSAEAPAPLELEHVEGAVQVNIQMQGYAPVTRSLRGEDFHEHEGVLRAEFTLKLTPQPASAARRKVPAARVARTLEPPAPGEAAPINTAPPEPTHVAPEPEAAPSPAAPAPPSEPVNAAPPASAAPPAEPKQPAAEPAPAAAAPAPAAPAAEPAAQ
jgi:hypothetical protein